MKWKDEAGHGVGENVLAVANFFTLIVPFFGFIGLGKASDFAHELREKRANKVAPAA